MCIDIKEFIKKHPKLTEEDKEILLHELEHHYKYEEKLRSKYYEVTTLIGKALKIISDLLLDSKYSSLLAKIYAECNIHPAKNFSLTQISNLEELKEFNFQLKESYPQEIIEYPSLYTFIIKGYLRKGKNNE